MRCKFTCMHRVRVRARTMKFPSELPAPDPFAPFNERIICFLIYGNHSGAQLLLRCVEYSFFFSSTDFLISWSRYAATRHECLVGNFYRGQMIIAFKTEPGKICSFLRGIIDNIAQQKGLFCSSRRDLLNFRRTNEIKSVCHCANYRTQMLLRSFSSHRKYQWILFY